jgi:hypothetical protein
MGIGFISFWIVTTAIIIDGIVNVNSYYLGLLSLFIILILSLISFYYGSKIYLKNINIKSSKIKSDASFVFISDVHMGSNSIKHLKKIILKLKKQNYDFLLIGGDLIDSSSFDISTLKIIKENISCPIYFVTGNHEYYLKNSSTRIKEINNIGINHISNSNKEINEINIIGIDDNLNKNKQVEIIKDKYLKEKFNLILIHKPSIWDKIYNESDLMLAGHCHAGQLKPFHLFVKLQFKYIYGLYSFNNSKLYVSSGVGTWGPKMRLGTFNEIILFHLSK